MFPGKYFNISFEIKTPYISVTSLPWPHRQMYSCIRQKGGRTSSKSPRRKGSEDPRMFKRTITPQYKAK